MAGLDASIYGSMKPIDTGDPMEYARNAMAMRTANLQQQQMQFNMMKAQEDLIHQRQQRAQAAAAYAKDQAAEKAANAFYGKTGAPASVTAAPSDMAGAASDVGMMGGAQGYTPGSVNTMTNPAQPKNFDDAIAAALQRGDPASLLAARKLMAQKEAENTYKKSNLGVTQEEDKTAKGKSDVAKAGTDAQAAELDRAAKAMAYHANVLPSVTQENYAAWRANALKDLPNLAGVVPEVPPADPAQFEQFKRALMMKASDGIKTHYEKITKGDQTYIVGIDAQGNATPVPGTEGEVKPSKETKSKLQQLHEYGDELKANLEKDPNNEGLKRQLAEVQDNINKEAKIPGDPLATIPVNSKLFLDQTVKHEKDLRAVNGSIQKVDRATKKIEAILDPKNDKAFNDLFGGYTAYGTQLKSGDTADVKGKLDSLKSEMKAAGLDIIRNKGGVGAMTEKEWPIVQDMIDTLSPTMSVNNARKVISGVMDILRNAAENDKSVYNGTWGQTQFHKKDYAYVPMGGKADDATPSGGPSADDLVKMYSGAKK